jgi:acyl-[acyl-carrier-protein]-phospholipid O-acyltransferase / long-chain-fatty-acid--[acyl-carrier-protein] ligase
MEHSQFYLLRLKRFLPLFVTQALGAFNDNGFKQALVILVTYGLAAKNGFDARLIITIAAGVFILPFFLFSATAGQLADKYDKAMLIRRIKFIEIILMGFAAFGFYLEDISFLLFVLFLMGTQSSFFGPLKYGILPQLLKKQELIAGNALIETGTFLAILVGTMYGGLLITKNMGAEIVSVSLIGLAFFGYLAARKIPAIAPQTPDLKINFNMFSETVRIIKHAGGNRTVFLSILGISWFWLVGALYLAQFPTFSHDALFADEMVSTLFVAIFTIGIAIGSLACNKLLKGVVSAKYVPLAALAITVFSVDLYFASRNAVALSGAGSFTDIWAFLATPRNWRILLDLFMIAFSGGLFAVPLYALIQESSDPHHVSRNIAANNIVNALFMVVSTVLAGLMLSAGYTIPQLFLTIGILNGFVAAYICKLLPQEVVKGLGRQLFRLFFRVEIIGEENIAKAGDKAVIVANHVSYLDGPILASFWPGKPSFAINTQIAEKWWAKLAFPFFDFLPLDPSNPMAIKTLVRTVESGEHIVIFPEGRITVTGALMKVYEGPGTVALHADAPILPVRIDGAQYSKFSKLGKRVKTSWFPKITITIMPPQKLEAPENLTGARRREVVANKLYDLMTSMVFETGPYKRTLFDALLDARAQHGRKTLILEDVERAPLSFDRLVLASFVLGGRIAKRTERGEHVGVFLPNTNAMGVTFFALQAYGRIPSHLNYSTGTKNLRSACCTAQLKIVLTSRRFIEIGELEHLIEAMSDLVEIVYLEDIKAEIGLTAKLSGLLKKLAPRFFYHRQSGNVSPDDPAVILFTSGSEGVPKGVVLSHTNLQANRLQVSARIDLNAEDIVFNALPLFHSFGLSGAFLLPLLGGVKVFLYPSPLHYKIVPVMVYETDATILFGTDTFLNGYARMAHPYDFYSIRYVIAGAEKVKEETRKIWSDKFGIRIFEGYGATETAPVLAVNTAMHCKPGSVGRLLPSIEHKLQPVPGIKNGGRLFVKGPNIMLGYLMADNPGKLQPVSDGWYDTGDIVEIDDDGFVKIVGRAKRFAKIAGEMISLTAVEAHVNTTWPDLSHAVVAVPDEKKGERLVLVTEKEEADRTELIDAGKRAGIAEIMIPRLILKIGELPLMGTGKIDYVGIAEYVRTKLGRKK